MFNFVLSRKGTAHVKECVALAAARTRAHSRCVLLVPCGRARFPVLLTPSFSDRMFFATPSLLRRVLLHGLLGECRPLEMRCLFWQLLQLLRLLLPLVRSNIWRIPWQPWPCLRRTIQFILHTVLVLLGPFELISRLCDYRRQRVSLLVHRHDLFHGGHEGSVLLRQSVQNLYCLLVHVVRPVVRFRILLVRSTEATFKVFQKTMEFPQSRPCSFLIRSCGSRRVPSGMCCRTACSVVRNGPSLILVAVVHNLNFCHGQWCCGRVVVLCCVLCSGVCVVVVLWRCGVSIQNPRVSIQNEPVFTFKTLPCVPAPRAHVFQHVRVVPVHTGTF